MMNRHQFLQPPNRVGFSCLGFWHGFYFPGSLDNDLGYTCMAVCCQMRHVVPSPHLGATTAEHCWGQSGRTASGQIVSFNCCWKSSCTWIVFGTCVTWFWSSQLFLSWPYPQQGNLHKFALASHLEVSSTAGARSDVLRPQIMGDAQSQLGQGPETRQNVMGPMGQIQTYGYTFENMIMILFPTHLNTEDGMPTGWSLRHKKWRMFENLCLADID